MNSVAESNCDLLDAERFRKDGFQTLCPLLTRSQLELLRRHLQSESLPEPAGWEKGRAVTDPLLFHFATLPALLPILRPLLGGDVILWGAQVVVREPGAVHPWHSDIESSDPDEAFVSVWIGIENTNRDSGLQLISRSHRFRQTIQEVARANGFRRGEASREVALEWAREFDGGSEFVQPEMKDGDALIFDGHLWHGSHNVRNEGTRKALLVQYAAASAKVLMPDLAQLEWPFRYKQTPVPVLIVSGRDPGTNHVVAPPSQDRQLAGIQISPIRLPLSGDGETGWKPHHLFAGATSILELMSSHVSVLNPKCCPHPLHAHREEEILIVLDGNAELTIANGNCLENTRVEYLASGSFVYYPAYQYHTIRNATSTPITYLMLKWTGQPAPADCPLATKIIEPKKDISVAPAPFHSQLLFEGATSYLENLHAHLTTLQPNGGYQPHSDPYDVAIVILGGNVDIMGKQVAANDVVYCPAGLPHDMKNSGKDTARYLVFEFHGPKSALTDA